MFTFYCKSCLSSHFAWVPKASLRIHGVCVWTSGTVASCVRTDAQRPTRTAASCRSSARTASGGRRTGASSRVTRPRTHGSDGVSSRDRMAAWELRSLKCANSWGTIRNACWRHFLEMWQPEVMMASDSGSLAMSRFRLRKPPSAHKSFATCSSASTS